MDREQAEPFPDNWAYLKVELNWLDRVLMLAIARHRKETKEVERVAQSRADRVTSHWWKGIIVLDEDDSKHRKSSQDEGATSKLGYQQQIDSRIQASRRQETVLGLPSLRDRLQLTLFEKNLVLMSLATEINRRYGKIYSYLQDNEQAKLPTLDLVLKLLCRNDGEWRSARTHLTSSSPLTQQGLVEFLAAEAEPLLTRRIKLADALVNYLLADRPDLQALETLLQFSQASSTRPAASTPPVSRLSRWTLSPSESLASSRATTSPDWSNLILPPTLLADLQHLCCRVQLRSQVDEVWGFQPKLQGITESSASPGTVVLLAGAAGTGKTTAAAAIAQVLQTSLVCVDLALVKPADFLPLLQEIAAHAPTLLLLKSAGIWLGRSSSLSQAEIHQFLSQRQQSRGITLLSVRLRQSVKLYWQRQFDQILEFPLPNPGDRLQLWQQTFPPQVPLDSEIDWQWLAQHWSLSGGEIKAIAREAAFYAAAVPGTKLGMVHLKQAWEQRRQKMGSSKFKRELK